MLLSVASWLSFINEIFLDLNMDNLKSQLDQSETRRKKAEEYMKGVESEIKHVIAICITRALL